MELETLYQLMNVLHQKTIIEEKRLLLQRLAEQQEELKGCFERKGARLQLVLSPETYEQFTKTERSILKSTLLPLGFLRDLERLRIVKENREFSDISLYHRIAAEALYLFNRQERIVVDMPPNKKMKEAYRERLLRATEEKQQDNKILMMAGTNTILKQMETRVNEMYGTTGWKVPVAPKVKDIIFKQLKCLGGNHG